MIFKTDNTRPAPELLPALALLGWLILRAETSAALLPIVVFVSGSALYITARRATVRILYVSLTIIALIAIYQIIGAALIPDSPLVTRVQPASIMFNTNVLGAVMVWGSIWAYTRGQKKQALVFVAILLLTNSVTSMLALVIASLIYYHHTTRPIRGREWLALTIILGILIGLEIDRSPYPIMAYRFNLWRAAWLGWLDRPLIGSGVGSFRSTFQTYSQTADYPHIHAHNIALQALAELGAVGLGLGLWLAGSAIRPLRALTAPQRATLAALVVQCSLDYVFWVPGALWLWVMVWRGLSDQRSQIVTEKPKIPRFGSLYGFLLLSFLLFAWLISQTDRYTILILYGLGMMVVYYLLTVRSDLPARFYMASQKNGEI